MAEPREKTTTPTRRRRSDAVRSQDAILNAARVVLGARPDASMDEIAAQAGVTRQTVYAHFASRDALVLALVNAAAAEYAAMLDAADMETAPPVDALARFLDAGWQLMRRHPLILAPESARVPRPDTDDPHDVVPPRLERLIRRGQDTGDFDASLPAAWLAAAVLGLQHVAAAQASTGRFTAQESARLCLESALRLCGGAGQPSGITL